MSTRKPQPAAPARGKVPVAVKLGKPYGVAGDDNTAWWSTITAYVKRHQGWASGEALHERGVPVGFLRYCVRRGWLVELARAPKPKAKTVKAVAPKAEGSEE